MSAITDYKRCDSAQCLAIVALGTRYCCTPCSAAAEATPVYEPHEHSEGCQERQGGRQWIAARLEELGR